jgi:L-ascorbate metabolism protein UlaG (beta-lactamase superfamily)
MSRCAAAAGKVEVQWPGQAIMKVTTPGGKVIVIDPWLTTNPKTPAEYKKLDALGSAPAFPRGARAPRSTPWSWRRPPTGPAADLPARRALELA